MGGGFGNVRMSAKAAKRLQEKGQEQHQDCIEVWPENWESVLFFMDNCFTQMRVGVGGATGLDYTAVLATLRLYHRQRQKIIDLFEDIKVIERAALEAMAQR